MRVDHGGGCLRRDRRANVRYRLIADVRYRLRAGILRPSSHEPLGAVSEQRMLSFFNRLWQKPDTDVVDERLESVSADLPFELRSKIFDQLATISIAGAGLSVTLIGSLLQNESRIVWLSVILFGLAAITAVSGNMRLIDGLTRRRSVLRRTRLDAQIAMGQIGMAVGILCMSIYHQDERAPVQAASVRPAR